MRTHLKTFLRRAQRAGRHVPRFVERELRSFVQCGVLAHGFLRVYCKAFRKNVTGQAATTTAKARNSARYGGARPKT